MSTDTRPSVTVVGVMDIHPILGVYIGLDAIPDIGLEDGDEVLVTIRKREAGEGEGD